MKKIAMFIFFTICLFSKSLFADDSVARHYNSKYAQEGILEIGGGISFSAVVEDEYKLYFAGLTPILNYYFFNKIHFGISPSSYFSYYVIDKEENCKTISLHPTLSGGYTFNINNNLFFDISPNIGYGYSKSIGCCNDARMKSVIYGLNFSLKYDLQGALFNISLNQSYTDYFDKTEDYVDNNYNIRLGLGFSLYFDIK